MLRVVCPARHYKNQSISVGVPVEQDTMKDIRLRDKKAS